MTAQEDPPAPAVPRLAWPWAVGAAVLVADQLVKLLILGRFAPGDSLPVIPSVLHLTYVQNTGAAFGLLRGQLGIFIALSATVMLWIAWMLLSRRRQPMAVLAASGLLLGGAAGNLIDRVRFGYVVDFIDLRVWPVFNIADSAITIGVALLLWHSFRADKRPATGDQQPATRDQRPATRDQRPEKRVTSDR
ncbi:MAG TPA: signal peptidase II [bacterium]